MIFIDTNILLRFLVQSSNPADQIRRIAAAELFAAVERGEQQITSSEVVLHEFAE